MPEQTNPDHDEFECKKCEGKFDIEDSIKICDKLYCEICASQIQN
jgi:hypothetical protein